MRKGNSSESTDLRFSAEGIPSEGKELEEILLSEVIDDKKITSLIPEWERLSGNEGYQHNLTLLADHLKDAIRAVRSSGEFGGLESKERHLATIASLLHDIGKPTGKMGSAPRDFGHEKPSAEIAEKYMRKWGYREQDIKTVLLVIYNDSIVSDIARNKVRDPKKNLTPGRLREILGGDDSTIKILRAVNYGDVVATLGRRPDENFMEAYNRFFDKMLTAK